MHLAAQHCNYPYCQGGNIERYCLFLPTNHLYLLSLDSLYFAVLYLLLLNISVLCCIVLTVFDCLVLNANKYFSFCCLVLMLIEKNLFFDQLYLLFLNNAILEYSVPSFRKLYFILLYCNKLYICRL